MPARKPEHWSRRALPAVLLLPLSALFWLITTVRRALYRKGWLRSVRLPVPVIVVGNIAVGGSGKTPVVQWLVESLRALGYRPGVVSRGYGGTVSGVALVTPDADPEHHGDEPVLLARVCGCPVAIGADRPAAAHHLLQAHPECDVLISDDGLQHYRLGRDVELIVLDPATLGNAWLLPAGPLREGVSRLRHCDLVILHGDEAAAHEWSNGAVPLRRMHLLGDTVYRLDDPMVGRPLTDFGGFRVHAIAGIGRPERFFAQLTAAGLEVQPHPFVDHHRFTPDDFVFDDDAPSIMTAKDAVKCGAFSLTDAWVLPVKAVVEQGAIERILEKLKHGRETA